MFKSFEIALEKKLSDLKTKVDDAIANKNPTPFEAMEINEDIDSKIKAILESAREFHFNHLYRLYQIQEETTHQLERARIDLQRHKNCDIDFL